MMSKLEVKQTPLAELHRELGAKMIEFAGWNMPIYYSSIMNEHTAVREDVGIFDISHMGQFLLTGCGAEEWLNSMLTNDIRVLSIGEAQYTLLLNKQGGVIDDLIVYRVGEDRFFLVVNASKIDEDNAWLSKHLAEGLTFSNQSSSWSGMAVQGPNATAVFAKIFPNRDLPERNGVEMWEEQGESFILCRTGYTGEDGFEFFCPTRCGSDWFKAFVEHGAEPCGLGARDSLRLEVCYPLNGSDLSPKRTPLQAGLGFFCVLEKDFIGVDVLRSQQQSGLDERLVPIKYLAKGAPPRVHYGVFSKSGNLLGELCSGVMSPSLKEGIAMAYLPIDFTKVGTEVEIDVRGRRYPAQVVKKPFYKRA